MRSATFVALSLLSTGSLAAKPAVIDGITFIDTGDKLYVPIRDVAKQFHWPAGYDAKSKLALLNKRKLNPKEMRKSFDGKPLVSLQELGRNGVSVAFDPKTRLAKLRKKAKPDQMFLVRDGAKRVFVNKKQQMVAAYQGNRLVFRSIVSTGKAAKQTPTGIFKVQDYRAQAHRSSIYNQAYMPYSVQIVGNIFIHGMQNVPNQPTSNGCIRLPMKRAQWFYFWADKGTPVVILGKWPKGAA